MTGGVRWPAASGYAARTPCIIGRVFTPAGGLAAVFSGEGNSHVYALVQADGGDITPLVKRLNAALSGRGGGRNGFAQGSVQADGSTIRAFFHKEGME